MIYTHDFSGKQISHDAYLSLPHHEQQNYHPVLPRKRDSLAEDLIEIGIEAASLGIILGSFADDTNPDSFLGSSDPDVSSSSGFDGGFGGGDFSGGGAGSDF